MDSLIKEGDVNQSNNDVCFQVLPSAKLRSHDSCIGKSNLDTHLFVNRRSLACLQNHGFRMIVKCLKCWVDGMNSLQQKSYVYNQESSTYQIQLGASVVEIAVEVVLFRYP